MIVFQYCKAQVLCLLIMLYIGIIYTLDGYNLLKINPKFKCNFIFDLLFGVSELAVLFDGITACSVNFLDSIPRIVNLLLHLGMFISYELVITLLFLYWISVTVGIPKEKWKTALYILPSAIFILLTICFLPELKFIQGEYTNYSMGVSLYMCYISVIIYCVLTVFVFITKYTYISKKNMRNIIMMILYIFFILLLQIIFPEVLISCIITAIIVICIYLNMENIMLYGLEHYHNEMIMGFAIMVDNKDDNTGGHIRRSSAYAIVIAKGLRKNKKYVSSITKDFINNLMKSAPMHDIGKIGIPDSILQKKGKLTAEEYEKMKEHTNIGGKIIKETFGHLYNNEYEDMAFQVAMYHHEKWNGKGYPMGLAGTDIPLCARIITVADVFDALSTKRCYKYAMSLEQCYDIIKKGRGIDFDPDVVDAFLMNTDKIEQIYYDKQYMLK